MPRSPRLPRRVIRALLATAAVFILAAPAAQAGWVTGKGSLPIARADRVCADGIDFEIATYAASKRVGISQLGVWVGMPWGEIEPTPAVAPTGVAIPFQPLYVDPSEIGGAIFHWPGAPGEFTHHGKFRLRFDRRLAPGTPVHVGWGNWTLDIPSDTRFSFTVQPCKIDWVIDEPGELDLESVRPYVR